MKSEHEEPREAESGSPGTNRREFLGKSLGAVPVVLTVGNRHGWGGNSIHGTLWSSTGTDWKHRGGRWWHGRGWDKPKPPHFSTQHGNPPGPGTRPDSTPPPGYENPHGSQEQRARSEWNWQTPREDWRKWRPEKAEPQVSGWDWKSDKSEATPAQEIPVHPIDETIRDKK
jgi:hypothetical protein